MSRSSRTPNAIIENIRRMAKEMEEAVEDLAFFRSMVKYHDSNELSPFGIALVVSANKSNLDVDQFCNIIGITVEDYQKALYINGGQLS